MEDEGAENILTNYMKNRLLILLMTSFMLLGCIDNNKSTIQNNEYPKILTFSLGYIFKNNQWLQHIIISLYSYWQKLNIL